MSSPPPLQEILYPRLRWTPPPFKNPGSAPEAYPYLFAYRAYIVIIITFIHLQSTPPPPHFQTQNLGLGIEPTDICDVTLAWLASRVYYGSSMVGPVRCAPPPPTDTHTHFVTFLRRCIVIHKSITCIQDNCSFMNRFIRVALYVFVNINI